MGYRKDYFDGSISFGFCGFYIFRFGFRFGEISLVILGFVDFLFIFCSVFFFDGYSVLVKLGYLVGEVVGMRLEFMGFWVIFFYVIKLVLYRLEIVCK